MFACSHLSLRFQNYVQHHMVPYAGAPAQGNIMFPIQVGISYTNSILSIQEYHYEGSYILSAIPIKCILCICMQERPFVNVLKNQQNLNYKKWKQIF